MIYKTAFPGGVGDTRPQGRTIRPNRLGGRLKTGGFTPAAGSVSCRQNYY